MGGEVIAAGHSDLRIGNLATQTEDRTHSGSVPRKTPNASYLKPLKISNGPGSPQAHERLVESPSLGPYRDANAKDGKDGLDELAQSGPGFHTKELSAVEPDLNISLLCPMTAIVHAEDMSMEFTVKSDEQALPRLGGIRKWKRLARERHQDPVLHRSSA
ncbi:hypothetical protein Dsin_024386 [Dipteronia sinensis]|uniref:Uncharacterized protein n=1 Tax=Dipteronia sinensis TaxID=43782 RepID=A0AAD9ZU44_9ROSI|nr:hypothetical protein Dsin_024386 [Dipteronia sinensis]